MLLIENCPVIFQLSNPVDNKNCGYSYLINACFAFKASSLLNSNRNTSLEGLPGYTSLNFSRAAENVLGSNIKLIKQPKQKVLKVLKCS